MQHLHSCGNCRHAFRAVAYLRAERDQPVPGPSPGAGDEALRAAVENTERRRTAGSFWSGFALGVLLAGAVALAAWFAFRHIEPGRFFQ